MFHILKMPLATTGPWIWAILPTQMSLSQPSSHKKFNRLELALGTIRSITSWRYILPAILAILTNHPRYLPKIEWANDSCVHNIFRLYELIFWRRVGIRAELSSYLKDGRTSYYCHSWESVFAL